MIESEKESKKPGPGRPGSGASIRKTSSSSSSPAVRASSMDRPSSAGGVRNQVWTLEKKNKQLNNATKQLEEKVKNLAQKSTAVKKTNDNSPAVRTVPRVAAPKVRTNFLFNYLDKKSEFFHCWFCDALVKISFNMLNAN